MDSTPFIHKLRYEVNFNGYFVRNEYTFYVSFEEKNPYTIFDTPFEIHEFVINFEFDIHVRCKKWT